MGAHVLMGDLSAAAVSLEAVKAVTEVTRIPSAPYGALLLPRGKAASPKCSRWCKQPLQKRSVVGEGFGLIITGFAEAMLYNSLGRYGEAARAAEMRGLPNRDGRRALGCARRTRRGSNSK